MSCCTTLHANIDPAAMTEGNTSLSARIEHYWSRRAEGYGQTRRKELCSDKKYLWLAEILPHLPGARSGEALDMVDVGTGTGFFAILLAQLGHRVTGVDMSRAMLDEGERLAREAGCTARFCRMDAAALDMPDQSMDVIVTRNLTWTLPDAAAAYREWHRVLRPGGVLLNFDADYGDISFVDVVRHAGSHAHTGMDEDMLKECESIRRQLPLCGISRPQWDREQVLAAGFAHCRCDRDLSSRVYAGQDETYNPVPMFALHAIK